MDEYIDEWISIIPPTEGDVCDQCGEPVNLGLSFGTLQGAISVCAGCFRRGQVLLDRYEADAQDDAREPGEEG